MWWRFSAVLLLCATTPAGVRCTGETMLGPLASTHITSPTAIWGFVFLCGANEDAPLLAQPQVQRACGPVCQQMRVLGSDEAKRLARDVDVANGRQHTGDPREPPPQPAQRLLTILFGNNRHGTEPLQALTQRVHRTGGQRTAVPQSFECRTALLADDPLESVPNRFVSVDVEAHNRTRTRLYHRCRQSFSRR